MTDPSKRTFQTKEVIILARRDSLGGGRATSTTSLSFHEEPRKTKTKKGKRKKEDEAPPPSSQAPPTHPPTHPWKPSAGNYNFNGKLFISVSLKKKRWREKRCWRPEKTRNEDQASFWFEWQIYTLGLVLIWGRSARNVFFFFSFFLKKKN